MSHLKTTRCLMLILALAIGMRVSAEVAYTGGNGAGDMMVYWTNVEAPYGGGNGAGDIMVHWMNSSDIPLPISLSIFTATIKNGSVVLNWETASETNNARFVIYRNGEAIGSMEGHGTSYKPHSYSYLDNIVVPGVQYKYILADVDYANIETRYEDKSIKVILSENDMITEFMMSAAYPNPFNPSTTIDYQLPDSRKVTLNIYDLNGQKVRTLINDIQDAGYYSLCFTANDLPSGMYICHFTAGANIKSMKLILMK